MASTREIQYILEELVFSHSKESTSKLSFRIENNIIRLCINDCVYEEPDFEFEGLKLTPSDLEFLERLSKTIQEYPETTSKALVLPEADRNNCLLKYIYYFSNERYLDECTFDRHGRPILQSVDFRIVKVLDLPITDILIQQLRSRLNVQEASKKITINFTCDFDILNIHTTIGLMGSLKRFAKAALKLRVGQLRTELVSFLVGNMRYTKNPFLNDNMFHFDGCGKRGSVKNIGFLLVDHQHSKYDTKNRLTPAVHDFFRSIKAKGVLLGLHPAYLTMDKPETLPAQLELFKAYSDNSTTLIRFHFLRCLYPRELRHLEANGFSEDYSFGFADSLAFRGGMTGPFRMWDLEKDCVNPVRVTPLTLMESTFHDYLNLPLAEAKEQGVKKLALCIKYGNTITLLWHNRSMYPYGFENNYYPALLKHIKFFLKKEELIG